jgi:D-alanyl-D-alanine carboxypeptidase/D-alanyl-D-alanine-endopeptidase (penicillin-binding protein 4)
MIRLVSLKRFTLQAGIAFFVSCGFCCAITFTDIVNSAIKRASHKDTVFAVLIKSTDGRVIYSKNSHKAVIPASNMKVVTTAAAVDYLGGDYRYVSRVGISPAGNLVIIGSGDPLFGYEDYNGVLSVISKAIQENSISEVNDIIVDTGIFDDERVNPSWPVSQLNKWYACEVSGLNFNANCIEMIVRNESGKSVVEIIPDTDFIKIDNRVRIVTNRSGAVGAYRLGGDINHLQVKGRCRKKQGPFKVAIERPAAFFGYVLAEHLISKDINVKGKLLITHAQGQYNIEKLVEFETPLSECLHKCNKNSLGLAAEALVKTIAAENSAGEKGGWLKGTGLICDYLKSLGLDEQEFFIDDGSGLSRKNRLSPNVITKVLMDMYKSSDRDFFYNSLAVGGEDGTIARYFRESRYKGKIRGKTGYIAGVKSFSGVCECSSGDYLFSIIVNGANGKTRRAINDIAKAVVNHF